MPVLPTLTGPVHSPPKAARRRSSWSCSHGYGADGNDLIGLAPVWAQLLPDAEFVAPDAPFPCEMSPYGRQWFSFQTRTPEAVLAGVRAAAPMLDGFLDEALRARGLDDGQLALVGFSQGTMMSLFVGLRRAKAAAAILGFSGRLLAPELLPREIRSRPPILLVHGDSDPVVPFELLALAATGLAAVGIAAEQLVRPGMGHAIDEEGLRRGGAFLRDGFARRA